HRNRRSHPAHLLGRPVPRRDDLASSCRRRVCVAAARRKPNVIPQFLAQPLTRYELEPIISAELRLIAQTVGVANLKSHAYPEAVPITQPGAESISDATLPRPDRIAQPDAGDHLRGGRPDRPLYGSQVVPERGLHAESAGDVPLLRGQFVDTRANMDGHSAVQRICID